MLKVDHRCQASAQLHVDHACDVTLVHPNIYPGRGCSAKFLVMCDATINGTPALIALSEPHHRARQLVEQTLAAGHQDATYRILGIRRSSALVLRSVREVPRVG